MKEIASARFDVALACPLPVPGSELAPFPPDEEGVDGVSGTAGGALNTPPRQSCEQPDGGTRVLVGVLAALTVARGEGVVCAEGDACTVADTVVCGVTVVVCCGTTVRVVARPVAEHSSW